MNKNFLVFDTETTGVTPQDSPVQLAVALVDSHSFEIQDHFVSLINPERLIHPAAQAVHGISDAMVAQQPILKDVIDDRLFGWFEQCDIWCGHNIKFDVRMCTPYLPPTPILLDTLTLARALFPKWRNHKLQTAVQNLSLPERAAHDALGDVLSCVDFLKAVANGRSANLLAQAAQSSMLHQRRDILNRLGV